MSNVICTPYLGYIPADTDRYYRRYAVYHDIRSNVRSQKDTVHEAVKEIHNKSRGNNNHTDHCHYYPAFPRHPLPSTINLRTDYL